MTRNLAGLMESRNPVEGPVKKFDTLAEYINKPGGLILNPRKGQHGSPKEKGILMVPLLTRFAIAFGFIALTVSAQAQSQEKNMSKIYSVFDIKKTLPLNSKEKIYRDYYVNLGSDAGAKPGSILAVYRRQGVVDYYRNTLHDDLLVPVAHMKVIMVGKTMSVARLESLTAAKQIPVVEFNAVMLDDRVELVSFDAPKTRNKSKKLRTVASRN